MVKKKCFNITERETAKRCIYHKSVIFKSFENKMVKKNMLKNARKTNFSINVSSVSY